MKTAKVVEFIVKYNGKGQPKGSEMREGLSLTKQPWMRHPSVLYILK